MHKPASARIENLAPEPLRFLQQCLAGFERQRSGISGSNEAATIAIRVGVGIRAPDEIDRERRIIQQVMKRRVHLNTFSLKRCWYGLNLKSPKFKLVDSLASCSGGHHGSIMPNDPSEFRAPPLF